MPDQPQDSLTISQEAVLAVLPETIIQVGEDLRIVAINRPESPVFTRQPVRGDHLGAVLDADAAGLVNGLIETAGATGGADGEYHTRTNVYKVTATALRSSPVTVVVLHDTTSRHNTEQALMHMMRDKSSVLESVSNELRAPLTAVIGYANLLSQPDPELDAASRSAMVEHMTDQAWDLAGIVDDLLAVAHTEIGDVHVAEVPVNLFANTAQVLESMGDRGSLITVTGDKSTTGVGDPGRIRQIARNLLSNALTHGSEPITVNVASDEIHAYLSVKDRGAGVAKELEKEVFSRTRSAPDSPNQTRVGIGLWISRELAELMGGHLEYSREHGLTVFRLAMPLLADR